MTLSTTVRIPLEHPAYKDHFPDFLIVPGVVILEQVLAACAREGVPTRHIKTCKFLKMPPPGLNAELSITMKPGPQASLTLSAGDIVYLRATLT